jgi:hypothetical protein
MSDTIHRNEARIERRGEHLIRVDADGSCMHATAFEISLWERLQELEAVGTALCDNPSEEDDWECVRASDLNRLRQILGDRWQ